MREKSIPKTVAALLSAPYNPRSLSEQAGQALTFSMEEFGDLSGLVFNLRTGHLVSGHQRRDRLPAKAPIINFIKAPDDNGTVGLGHIAVGKKLWPIRFVDWNETKEKAANLVSNNPEIAGEFTPQVGKLLDEIKAAMPEIFDQALLFKIGDDLLPLNEESQGAENGAEPQYDLSPMPYESYNYVVVIFKNDIDWTAAVEHFKLKTVRDPSGGSKAVGLGLVVDGAEYLSRIAKKP